MYANIYGNKITHALIPGNVPRSELVRSILHAIDAIWPEGRTQEHASNIPGSRRYIVSRHCFVNYKQFVVNGKF